MSEENKPCPLCGEKVIEGYNEDEMKYTFECYPCGLILTGDCEVKETEKIWNKRQPDPIINELNAEQTTKRKNQTNRTMIEHIKAFLDGFNCACNLDDENRKKMQEILNEIMKRSVETESEK